MSDLHYIDTASKAEMQRRLDEFAHRCDVVAEVVFQLRYDDRRVFETWLRGLIAESENPFWVLHEHPLYLIADYLGLDPADMDSGPQANAYIRLAQQRNW